jgi:hypothetical protein
LEAAFFGEGLELAELLLPGGGLDGEGLAFVIGGGVCDQAHIPHLRGVNFWLIHSFENVRFRFLFGFYCVVVGLCRSSHQIPSRLDISILVV